MVRQRASRRFRLVGTAIAAVAFLALLLPALAASPQSASPHAALGKGALAGLKVQANGAFTYQRPGSRWLVDRKGVHFIKAASPTPTISLFLNSQTVITSKGKKLQSDFGADMDLTSSGLLDLFVGIGNTKANGFQFNDFDASGLPSTEFTHTEKANHSGATANIDTGSPSDAGPYATIINLSFQSTSATANTCMTGSETLYEGTVTGALSFNSNTRSTGTFDMTFPIPGNLDIDHSCVPPSSTSSTPPPPPVICDSSFFFDASNKAGTMNVAGGFSPATGTATSTDLDVFHDRTVKLTDTAAQGGLFGFLFAQQPAGDQAGEFSSTGATDKIITTNTPFSRGAGKAVSTIAPSVSTFSCKDNGVKKTQTDQFYDDPSHPTTTQLKSVSGNKLKFSFDMGGNVTVPDTAPFWNGFIDVETFA